MAARPLAPAIALAAILFAAACGDGSNAVLCGGAFEACCRRPSGELSCDQPANLPKTNRLFCQIFRNGTNDCLPCGFEDEACCYVPNVGAFGCQSGLVCRRVPEVVNGGICVRAGEQPGGL